MKIKKDDLRSAASDGLLQDEQVDALWEALEARSAGRPRLDLGQVALYFGALVVIAAMTWFISAWWSDFGRIGTLAVCSAYAGAFFLAGRSLWETGRHRVAAGLLLTVTVSLTPLIVLALDRTAGLWLELDPLGFPGPTFWMHYRWFAMELATIGVGVAMARRFPFPFLMAPVSLALWYFFMDLTPVLTGDPGFTRGERASVSVVAGLVLLLIAYLVDRRTRGDFAFWLYLCGLLSFWGGLTFPYTHNWAPTVVYFGVSLLLMVLSVALERPVFLVFGALGAYFYLGHLVYVVFADFFTFPLVLASSGALVIYFAIKYQQHKERIENLVRSAVPLPLRRLLPGARGNLAVRE